MSVKLGSVIKEIRKSKGISGKFVSDKVGIDPSTLSKYENNSRKVPVDLLPDLAALFEVEVDYFFKYKIGDTPTKNELNANSA
ncbi:Helix-turn-helix domain protein [compost metagenome]